MKNSALIATVIILMGGIVAAYITFYEAPEECFVREMRSWSIENKLADKVQGITQENAKMAVAKAKNTLKEYDRSDFSNKDSREIYLQIGTLFEYCNIKN